MNPYRCRILAILLPLVLALAACGGGGGTGSTSSENPSSDDGLRLIQVSHAFPVLSDALAHQSSLEMAPFDGTIVSLKTGRMVFQAQSLSAPALASRLAEDKANIVKINTPRLTDNFLLIEGGLEAGTHPFDPFLEEDWSIADGNIRVVAQMAKLGKLKGIAFDPESYTGRSLFRYADYTQVTFEQCRTKIRDRGRQFMRAIQEEYPHSQVFLLGGLSMLRRFIKEDMNIPGKTLETSPLAAPYNLLPAFINGMLDVIDPGMELVDGNEVTYSFYRDSLYQGQRKVTGIDALPLIDPANHQKYKDQLKIGMSIYLDASYNQYNRPCYIAFYTPLKNVLDKFFEYQVFWSLKTTDRYLWIYAEHTDWPARKDIPAGAEEAIRRARLKAVNGQPLGFDIKPEIDQAEKQLVNAGY